MIRSAPERQGWWLAGHVGWLRAGAVAFLAGALLVPNGWGQIGGGRVFQRVPAGTSFEPRFMPFRTAAPLENYGGMGTAPWVTLEYPGRAAEKAYLHVPSSRLYLAAPAEAVAPAQPMSRQDRAARVYTSQDVRALWTNRRVLTAWLNFDAASEALRQRLQEAGTLPGGARVQALATKVYAEISTEGGGAVVLKKLSGEVVTTEAPVPTWVEPLFHQVFIACVPAPRPARPPLSQAVLGNRYETERRCGLMSEEGRWLARPEFEFMEDVHGSGHYMGDGPYLLLLRGDEPCMATLHMPVKVACLGQPLSSLLGSGKLPFSRSNPDSPRRGGDAIGYVSADGAWAIQPRFREAQGFSGRVATVQQAGVPAVIDGTGAWLTPPVPGDPVSARWLAERGMGRNSGTGLINRSGQMVIPFLFPKVEAVDAGRYRVCHQNGCDIVSVPKAKDLPPPVKPIAAKVAPQVLAASAHWIPTAEDGRWGYQDASGRWTVKPAFEETEPFEDGLAKARSGGLWGIILPGGQWLHPANLQWISPYSSGVAVAQDSQGRHVLLRADGKRIELTEGQVRSSFGADGWAVAGHSSRDGVGYIDREGEWVIPPRFSQAQPFVGGYAVVSGDLPEAWRPPNFKEPPYFLVSVHWLSPEVLALRARIGKEERLGLMDKLGNWLLPAP